ncbi:MAG: DegT/DnrJ/EryC1/StrS family aminotransferase [archaeon]
MKIPMVDLNAQYYSIKEDIDSAVKKVIESSAFIQGEFLEEFEKSFAQYLGKNHCIGTSSGTSALFVALKILDIKEGDEVITVPNSFIATASQIKAVNARSVFVDIDENTGLINADKIEGKITAKTKAIIPVHLYGNVCNMERIIEIAQKNNLKIVEDCCQAHGSEYTGKKVPVSDIGCFSFFPGKTLGAYGDAGCIVTDNEELAKKMKMFVNHGRETKYEHTYEGGNFRMHALQAAILSAKLKYLNQWIEKRKNLAEIYNNQLKEIKELGFFKSNEAINQAPYMYTIRVLNGKRNELIENLAQKEIASQIYYPITLNKQPIYLKEYENEAYPVAEKLAEEIVSIPLYPEMTQEQQDKVISSIKEFFC